MRLSTLASLLQPAFSTPSSDLVPVRGTEPAASTPFTESMPAEAITAVKGTHSSVPGVGFPGDINITVIEGQVGFTASSDRNKKENFLPVEGEEVLSKIRELSLTSWNFIGHDPKQFRHYGPMAQDFFAAFGHDALQPLGF
jgi:hypothetical protein